jgi:hypothetical protein
VGVGAMDRAVVVVVVENGQASVDGDADVVMCGFSSCCFFRFFPLRDLSCWVVTRGHPCGDHTASHHVYSATQGEAVLSVG